MCLTIFSYKQDDEIPIILISNRDEYYERPTAKSHYWEDYPTVLGGKDLKSGGSWLAINKNGSFASITNYCGTRLEKPPSPLSRGKIVKDFVLSNDHEEFLNSLSESCSQYQGFNLIAGWANKIYYFSNITKELVQLRDGLYGLSNHLLDSPWPKLIKAKQKFQDLISHQRNSFKPEEVFKFMTDTCGFPDEDLPDTGIGIELELFLSPIFIVGEQYGTRSTSILRISNSGKVDFYEQTYMSSGKRIDYSYNCFFIQ